MRLEPDTQLFNQVFGEEALPPISLPIAQQGDVLIQTLVDALTNAAAACFGIQLVKKPLLDEEWQAILAQPSLEVGSPK
jgi:lipoate-protein ligase A